MAGEVFAISDCLVNLAKQGYCNHFVCLCVCVCVWFFLGGKGGGGTPLRHGHKESYEDLNLKN